MEQLTVFFDEPAPVLTPAVHRIFALVGGLDQERPVLWGRHGMNLCEDYIGYPVKAPRDVTLAEVYALVTSLANDFGVCPVLPANEAASALRPAIANTVRAIALHNGQDLSDTWVWLDHINADPDDLLCILCESLYDGNNIINYIIAQATPTAS